MLHGPVGVAVQARRRGDQRLTPGAIGHMRSDPFERRAGERTVDPRRRRLGVEARVGRRVELRPPSGEPLLQGAIALVCHVRPTFRC
jgi:hypothetical protein